MRTRMRKVHNGGSTCGGKISRIQLTIVKRTVLNRKMVKRKANESAATTQPTKKRINGTNSPPKSESKIQKVKVSHRSHSTIEGTALTLGEGDVGQLGLGPDVMERVKPAVVPGVPQNVVQICAGGMHTVCLTSKGEVYTFGCNDEGALGRLTPEEDDSSQAEKVDLPHQIVQVSAGDSHTAALSDEGRVFIWGTFRDANGKIGLLPDGTVSFSPIEIMNGYTVKKIVSGTDHLGCLTSDGDVYTVGNAEQGQLGRVAECFSNRGGRKGLGQLLQPGRVVCRKKRTKFQDVWTGQYWMFVQEINDGPIHAWGLNNYYQLGFGDTTNRFVPEVVKAFPADKKWQEIVGGQHHTLALDYEGKVYALGRKEYGRLGLGTEAEETQEPTLVPGLADQKCTRIGCGTAVGFAVTDKGDVYGWGMGTSKQLAQREEDDLWEPTIMEGKQLETRSVVMVASGGQHTVLLAKDQ